MFKSPRLQETALVLGVALIALVSVFTLSGIWGLFNQWGWIGGGENRTITLSAQGKTVASPDTARFTASVVTKGDSAQSVQIRNTQTTDEVIEFLKQNGIKSEDIKTVSYNLYPQYDYIDGRQVPAGYFLEQGVQVQIKDLTKVGTLVSGVVEAGANQVYSVQYFIEDPEQFRAQARQEAFEKAREKAQEMARAADVRLGDLIGFSESSDGGMPIPILYERSDLGLGSGSSVPLEPGTQDVTVTVSVTYEIR